MHYLQEQELPMPGKRVTAKDIVMYITDNSLSYAYLLGFISLSPDQLKTFQLE
jgi:hypothetical protein